LPWLKTLFVVGPGSPFASFFSPPLPDQTPVRFGTAKVRTISIFPKNNFYLSLSVVPVAAPAFPRHPPPVSCPFITSPPLAEADAKIKKYQQPTKRPQEKTSLNG